MNVSCRLLEQSVTSGATPLWKHVVKSIWTKNEHFWDTDKTWWWWKLTKMFWGLVPQWHDWNPVFHSIESELTLWQLLLLYIWAWAMDMHHVYSGEVAALHQIGQVEVSPRSGQKMKYLYRVKTNPRFGHTFPRTGPEKSHWLILKINSTDHLGNLSPSFVPIGCPLPFGQILRRQLSISQSGPASNFGQFLEQCSGSRSGTKP